MSVEDVPNGQQPARRARRWLRRALELLLLGAVLYLTFDLLAGVGWSELENELLSASPRLVAVCTLLLAARYAVWGRRWSAALHRIGTAEGVARSTVGILAAAAVNHFTPSFRIFGGLLRARYVSRSSSTPFDVVYASVLFDQIVNQTTTGAMSAVAFVVTAWHLGKAGQSVAGGLVLVSLLLLLPLLWQRLRRRRRGAPRSETADPLIGIARRLRALADRGKGALETLELLVRDGRLVAEVLTLTLLYVTLNVGAAATAFAALGHPVSLLAVFLATSLGITLGALSGTPGGSLTTEAAMVTCFVLLGIPREHALAATLLYRGLHYVLVVVLGLPSLAALEISHRRSRLGASRLDEAGP